MKVDIFYKLFLTLFFVVFFIKCDKKLIKKNSVLSNDEASVVSEAEIKIQNTLDEKLLSLKGVSLLSKHIATFDMDYDNLLDAIVFLGFKNVQDNSFYQSKILFLKNNGKELIPIDSVTSSKKYIIPSQSKTFYSARGDGVIVEKFIPDSFGRLGSSFDSRGIIIYLENELYLDYISTNDVKFSYTLRDEIKYVSAENGLLCRDQPGKQGKVIHKLNYGEEVNVTGITDQELTIYDEDINESITDYWVIIQLETSNTYAKKGYVFNGYLVDENPN